MWDTTYHRRTNNASYYIPLSTRRALKIIYPSYTDALQHAHMYRLTSMRIIFECGLWEEYHRLQNFIAEKYKLHITAQGNYIQLNMQKLHTTKDGQVHATKQNNTIDML